jgi:hypothetical protein
MTTCKSLYFRMATSVCKKYVKNGWYKRLINLGFLTFYRFSELSLNLPGSNWTEKWFLAFISIIIGTKANSEFRFWQLSAIL